MGPLLGINRIGELAANGAERRAGLLRLPELVQRDAKLQQTVRRPPALWIALVALQEILRRLAEITLRIIGFTEPVLGAAGQAVFRILANKTAEARFRIAKLAAQQAFV